MASASLLTGGAKAASSSARSCGASLSSAAATLRRICAGLPALGMASTLAGAAPRPAQPAQALPHQAMLYAAPPPAPAQDGPAAHPPALWGNKPWSQPCAACPPVAGHTPRPGVPDCTAPDWPRTPRAGSSFKVAHIVSIKVGNAPVADQPFALEGAEGLHGFGQWHAAAPVQEVQIQPVCTRCLSERRQLCATPWAEALLGSTLLTRKTCSRIGAMASPTSFSDRPLPYISAVSTTCMPCSTA